MFTNCNAELIINKLDNGFTLKWEKKREKDSQEMFGPSGFEIISDPEALLQRIKELAV